MDVDNGSSQRVISFYTSADGTTWSLVEALTQAGTTSIFDSNAGIGVGANFAGTTWFITGAVYSAEVRNGIAGALALKFDPNDAASSSSTSWTSSLTREVWTIGQSGSPNAHLRDTGVNRLLSMPGTSGNDASTPDSATNSVTGDIDVRIKTSLPDWTPGSLSTHASKFRSSDNNRSWWFHQRTDGTLGLRWSTDGTNEILEYSSAAVGASDGTTKRVRYTLDVSNGSNVYEVRFYTSDDGSTWTSLGSTRTGGSATSIFNSAAVVRVGGVGTGTETLSGAVYYAEVRSGIDGTKVAVFDPDNAPSTASTTWAATESSSFETWTINQSGSPNAHLREGLTVSSVYGVPTGGTAWLAGTTAFYDFTDSSVGTNVPLLIGLDGFVNTATPGTYTSTMTTYDASNTPVDSGTSGNLVIDENTIDVEVVIARTMAFTNDTDSFFLAMDASVAATADRTYATSLSALTNAGSGYSLYAKSTTMTAGSYTMPGISSGTSSCVASGSFTTNAWGYTVGALTQGGSGSTATRLGDLNTGLYCGHGSSDVAVVTQTAPTAGDTIPVTYRAKINYLQKAGVYASTVTYTVVPSY